MSSGLRSAEIKYPPGCKEITEELSTDDLIRRLKDIAMAFQQMSQEENNKTYIPLALYLANDFFLENSSRDVRLLVACSIADVFRVFAPNAPYARADIIKRIFLFFIQQLKGLQDPKDATFKRYFYLLENLAWVKSFNICIELEDSQQIFCELFSLMFKIVNENHSDKVKNFMLDVLRPLITESDNVSSKLLQIILMQIIDPKKSSNKQAYWLAAQILTKTSDTLEPYITAFFAKAITRGVNENGDISDEEADQEMNELKQKFRKNKTNSNPIEVPQICDLIYELNQICPNIVKALLPHIEFKLKSNEVRERCEYSKLLARLFSDANSDLAKDYPETWKSFLGRFRDISVSVRVRCVQYSMHFLLNHPELRNDISEQLKQRQHDADENVRYEVVMAIVSAAKKGMDHINEDLLNFVKERTLDKKFKIRREALLGMSQLYRQYNYHLTNSETEVVSEQAQESLKMLSWIKNKCMHNYYQTQLEDKLLVERIFHTCLVPFSLNLTQRMKALYMFYCTIDSRAARTFNEMLKQQQAVRRQMKDVMDVICRTDKTDEKDALLKQKIALVAKNLTEPVKAEEYINKLAQNLETNFAAKQHMTAIVTSASFIQLTEENKCIAPSSSATIETSVREILKSLGFPVQTNSFYMIIKQLMERIAPIMIDYEGLLMLFNYVSDSLIGDGELDTQMNLSNSAIRGLQLIQIISVVFPALFYGRDIYNSYLLPFLWHRDTQPEVAEIVLQILANIGATSYSDLEPLNNSVLPWWTESEDFVSRLIDNFILKAATTKQAKYSIQCLNAIILDENERVKIYGQIIDKIKENGLSLESTTYFRFHLVALAMIAVNGGHLLFPKMLRSIVQKFVVQGLLLKDFRTEVEIDALQKSESGKTFTDINSVYEHLSNEVKTKNEGIKLLVRWIYGLKLNSLMVIPENQIEANNIYQKAASNAFQLLKTIIQTNGDLNEQGKAGTVLEKAYLKLSAALAMLKIASNDALTSINPTNNEPVFQKFSSTLDIMSAQQWHCLAHVFLDQQEFVREKFLTKLNKGLISLNLGLEFLSYLSLGGMFENNAFKNKLKTYLHLNLAKRRDVVKTRMTTNLKSVMPECVLPFVIHLLSHMSFYTQFDDVSQLEKVKECLWFIMEPLVLKNDLYSFTFFKKTFENIKLCVDRNTASQLKNSNDPNLAKLATVVNYKIFATSDLALGLVMSKTQNFLLKEFPVQPSLPGKYYTPSNDSNNANKNYLPQELQISPPKRCVLETEMLGRIAKSQSNSNKKRKSQQITNDDTLIDETTLVENDNSNNSLMRTRKQQLTLSSDNENDSNHSVDNVETKKVVEKSEYDFDDSEEIGNRSESSNQQAESSQKRTRGRPPRQTRLQQQQSQSKQPNEDSTDRESSPPRKSARIALKSSPTHRSPSPEMEVETTPAEKVEKSSSTVSTRATRISGRLAGKK